MDPLSSVRFVKHGCICFDVDDVVVYVDPYMVPDAPHDADLIIITHPHSDHFSPDDIAKVKKDDTCYASTLDVGAMLMEAFDINPDYFTAISAGSPSAVFECGAMVTPVVAENQNHPAGFGFGLLLNLGGVRYYISGDTDVLDEDVVCDVLFVCCDGVWNMPSFETRIPAELEKMEHRPALVVPYHYAEEENPGTGGNGKKLCAILRQKGYQCEEWKDSFFR